MINKFKTRKEVTAYLKTKDIDTSKWTEEKWLSMNKGMGEIHIMDLAEKIHDTINESTPNLLNDGEWHIPFGDDINYRIGDFVHNRNDDTHLMMAAIKVATARCARISYKSLGDDKEHDYDADIKLHDRLLKDKHMSPFEHIARAMTDEEFIGYSQEEAEHGNVYPVTDKHYGWSRNLRGFIQYREIVESNN